MRVIRLGGSLLSYPELVASLRAWHECQTEGPDFIVVGTGQFGETMRSLHTMHGLAEEFSHETCLDLMEISARILANLAPEWKLLDPIPTDCQNLDPRGQWIVSSPRTLLAEEVDPLPACWSVTSDSIAAWIAGQLGAQELVLLKSCLPPSDANRESAAQSGYVDRFFVHASKSVTQVRCVNLRDERFSEIRLSR